MTLGTGPFEYSPQSVSPPGETLKETLEALGISQADLARRTGLSTKHVNQIIQGVAILSAETATLLERATGTRAEIWNSLEARWRTQQQREQEDQVLQGQLSWLDNFPVRELVTRGVLTNGEKSVTNLRRLLEFFGVASPQIAEELWDTYQLAFRRSTAKKPNRYATALWLRLCVRAAREQDCRPYRRDALVELIPTLRTLTLREPATWFTELPALCAEVGVAVVFERSLTGAHISGVTRWLTPDKVMIALSDRFKRIDHFWFAFFHEVAHVLHHGKRLTFLDEDPNKDPEQSTEEEEANQFAADVLIPPHLTSDYQMLRAHPKPFTRIEAFAARAGIAEGIVVGRLQRDHNQGNLGGLAFNEGHRYLARFNFLDYP